MPQHPADFRTWTGEGAPGIYFDDDPASSAASAAAGGATISSTPTSAGRPREQEPGLPAWPKRVTSAGRALRDEALKNKKPLRLRQPIEGLKALDRHTVQFNAGGAAAALHRDLAAVTCLGAVAREVVEFYGDKIGEHPVAPGRSAWRSGGAASLIVLERNPNYRERATTPSRRPAMPRPGHPGALQGRRLPMIDRSRSR